MTPDNYIQSFETYEDLRLTLQIQRRERRVNRLFWLSVALLTVPVGMAVWGGM